MRVRSLSINQLTSQNEKLRKIQQILSLFLKNIVNDETIAILFPYEICKLLHFTEILFAYLRALLSGIASAAEIAYYSYMYAVVDQKHYKKITSYIRAAALVGKFFAFGLAQFLVSTGYGSYLLLNQVSVNQLLLKERPYLVDEVNYSKLP